ncbi:TPA: lpg2546 family Dot/Icm T4SS effector [Legionella pneumophila]
MEMKMSITVKSLDFDQCISNRKYKESLQTNDGRKVWDANSLFNANKEILGKNNNGDPIHVFVGSNRQNLKADLINLNAGAATLFIPVAQELCDVMGATFHPLLVPDLICENAAIGDTFHSALQVIKDLNDLNSLDSKSLAELVKSALSGQLNSLHCISDESKFLMLYSQIQYMAQQYPDEKINFEFYDDKEDILKPLYEIFSRNPDLVPANVTLNIKRYLNGNLMETDFNPILGLGSQQENYQNIVKWIHKQSSSNLRSGNCCQVLEMDNEKIARYCRFGKDETRLKLLDSLENLAKHQVGQKDQKMDDFIKESYQKMGGSKDMDSITLQKSLEEISSAIKVTEAINKVIANYRKEAKSLFSVGMNAKADRIEKALLNVPVEDRGKIFSNDKASPELIAIRAALASHRYFGKRGNVYYKDEARTVIDENKAATTYNNLRKQFANLRTQSHVDAQVELEHSPEVSRTLKL